MGCLSWHPWQLARPQAAHTAGKTLLVLGYQADSPAGVKVATDDTTAEMSPAQSPLLGLSQDRSVAVVPVCSGIMNLAEYITNLD